VTLRETSTNKLTKHGNSHPTLITSHHTAKSQNYGMLTMILRPYSHMSYLLTVLLFPHKSFCGSINILQNTY